MLFTLQTQAFDFGRSNDQHWHRVPAGLRTAFSGNGVELPAAAFFFQHEAERLRLVTYTRDEAHLYLLTKKEHGIEVHQPTHTGLSDHITDYPIFTTGIESASAELEDGVVRAAGPGTFVYRCLRDGRAREELEPSQVPRWDFFFRPVLSRLGLPHRRRLALLRQEQQKAQALQADLEAAQRQGLDRARHSFASILLVVFAVLCIPMVLAAVLGSEVYLGVLGLGLFLVGFWWSGHLRGEPALWARYLTNQSFRQYFGPVPDLTDRVRDSRIEVERIAGQIVLIQREEAALQAQADEHLTRSTDSEIWRELQVTLGVLHTQALKYFELVPREAEAASAGALSGHGGRQPIVPQSQPNSPGGFPIKSWALL